MTEHLKDLAQLEHPDELQRILAAVYLMLEAEAEAKKFLESLADA